MRASSALLMVLLSGEMGRMATLAMIALAVLLTLLVGVFTLRGRRSHTLSRLASGPSCGRTSCRR